MIKYCTLFCLTALFTISVSNAQVGVNTTNPASVLDVVASDAAAPNEQDGILIPRIEDFPATNPGAAQDGMLVFLNTDSGSDPRGFYYWDNPNSRWVGFGKEGEWKDGQNSDGDNLIFAMQASTASQDIVFTDDGSNGTSFGLGTDDPVERFEMRGDGDNDLQLTSANTNPPNLIVYNTGGSIDNPVSLPADREIGALVAKSLDNNGIIKETGGVRFFTDELSSNGRVPTRFTVTLRERDNTDGNSNQVDRLVIKPDGQTGISVSDPTASLHIQSGSNNAESAPIKFTIDGIVGNNNLMTNPEAGALEYDGDHLYITDDSNVRHEIATVGGGGGGSAPATVTSSLNFGNINANSTSEVTVTLTGINPNTMSCNCTPKYYVAPGLMWSCWVQGTNQVRVRMANITNSNLNGVNTTMSVSAILHN